MKKNHAFGILITINLLSLSCASRHAVTGPHDPLYIEREESNKIPESKHYDTYTQREGSLVEIREYKPKEGETYSSFEKRLHNTLELQNYQITELGRKIQELSKSIISLEEQVKSSEQLNSDLQEEVGNAEQWSLSSTSKSSSEKSELSHFSRYVVMKGDTLQSIANNIYGTHTGWLTLYRFNSKVLVNGPHNIEIGDELIIPPVMAPLSEAPRNKDPFQGME